MAESSALLHSGENGEAKGDDEGGVHVTVEDECEFGGEATEQRASELVL